jgi:hypothetical protein
VSQVVQSSQPPAVTSSYGWQTFSQCSNQACIPTTRALTSDTSTMFERLLTREPWGLGGVPLLVAEHRDWIQMRRAPGWKVARRERRGHQTDDDRCKRSQIHAADTEQQTLQGAR